MGKIDPTVVEQILKSNIENAVFRWMNVGERLVNMAPEPAFTAIKPLSGWSILVFAIPITDPILWVWHRSGDSRFVFANHLLERAAFAIVKETLSLSIKTVDLARDFAGVLSLVELAEQAGLGKRGLNNLLLHPTFGSWLQLHALAFDTDVPNEPQTAEDPCIKCGNCIRACPAKALRGKKFDRARCAQLVASPWHAKSRARALNATTYVECEECIRSCPIGRKPKQILGWKNEPN